MKGMIVSLFLALLLLVLIVAQAEAGSFRGVGGFRRNVFVAPNGFVIRSPSVVVINRGPFFFSQHRFSQHRFVRFANPVFIVPGQSFVGPTVVVPEPFICLEDGLGFINEASFFEHLHQFHDIAFETISSVIVRRGSQVFFFAR